MPIDYVIPFVNCSEVNWSLEYRKYVPATIDWSNNATRFRDWDETYSLEGDTAIGRYVCKRLFLSTSGPYEPTDHKYMGAMYERSKKVYYFAPDSTEATLMYDFSCKPGDVVSVHTYIYDTWFNMLVKKKRHVGYHGEDLTVVDWSPMGWPDEDDADKVYENRPGTVWIEGIGSPLDLLNDNPSWGTTGGVPAGRLLNCTLDGEVIFDRDDFNANSVPVPMDGKDQRFFTPRTVWTEIRLDTLQHADWYSRAGDEWVPNFETVEYTVTPYMTESDIWCSNDDYTLRREIHIKAQGESDARCCRARRQGSFSVLYNASPKEYYFFGGCISMCQPRY